MFTRKSLWLCSLFSAAFVSAAQEGPGLGVQATPAQIAAWDISIAPDGEGLPAGSGTVVDGEVLYLAQCVACHGFEGSGNPNNQLVGGHGSLSGPRPVKTVGSYWPYATTVFDYTRRAMPYAYSNSLTDDQVYSVTAYLLFLNGIIDKEDVMDANTLPQVEMPNRDNFVLAYPENPDW